MRNIPAPFEAMPQHRLAGSSREPSGCGNNEAKHFRTFSHHPEASLTAADLLAHCQAFREEHGILVLCDVLETIFETNEHSACVELLDDDEDEMECQYFTVQ